MVSDRPNPISAEPNRTIFLPNYSSADRTMFGQKGRTCSVNVPNFCRRFGSVRLLLNVFGVRSITTKLLLSAVLQSYVSLDVVLDFVTGTQRQDIVKWHKISHTAENNCAPRSLEFYDSLKYFRAAPGDVLCVENIPIFINNVACTRRP